MTKQRERILLVVALICLAGFAGDRFIVEPLLAAWKFRNERIGQLEQSIATGETLLERRSTIRDFWEEMSRRSLKDQSADAENEVLTATGEWARASRLTVTALKPRWMTDEAEDQRLEVRLSAKGDLPSISRFLYELESDPLALRVEDLQVRSRDDKGVELILEARFTGLVLPEVQP